MLFSRCCLLLFTSMFLGACVAIPKQQAKQQTVLELLSDKSWQESNMPMLENRSVDHAGMSLSHSLLNLFSNQELNAVVEQALSNNLDLRLAAERLQEAGFLSNVSQADKWPNISFGMDANHSKTGSFSADEKDRRTDYSANMSVGWELDLWGKLHQQHQAQRAKKNSLLQDYAAAQNLIAARVIQLWFDVISQTQIVNIQQQRIQQLERLSTVLKRRYLSGSASLSEWNSVRERHTQALTVIFDLRQNLTQRNYQLQALLGGYPKHFDQQILQRKYTENELLTVSLPPIVAGVPAHVIHQRPDIKAAWELVVAANANASADYLAMYPSIELTGQYGKNGTSFRRLMDEPSIWSLLGMIKIPLFNAGRLKNNYRASNSRAEQSYIVFLQRVLNAFHEIETALSEQLNLEQQEKTLHLAVNYSSDNALRAELDYRFGKIDLEDYLDRQVSAFDVLIQFVELNNKRLQNRVNLGLAIGQGV